MVKPHRTSFATRAGQVLAGNGLSIQVEQTGWKNNSDQESRFVATRHRTQGQFRFPPPSPRGSGGRAQPGVRPPSFNARSPGFGCTAVALLIPLHGMPHRKLKAEEPPRSPPPTLVNQGPFNRTVRTDHAETRTITREAPDASLQRPSTRLDARRLLPTSCVYRIARWCSATLFVSLFSYRRTHPNTR